MYWLLCLLTCHVFKYTEHIWTHWSSQACTSFVRLPPLSICCGKPMAHHPWVDYQEQPLMVFQLQQGNSSNSCNTIWRNLATGNARVHCISRLLRGVASDVKVPGSDLWSLSLIHQRWGWHGLQLNFKLLLQFRFQAPRKLRARHAGENHALWAPQDAPVQGFLNRRVHWPSIKSLGLVGPMCTPCRLEHHQNIIL